MNFPSEMACICLLLLCIGGCAAAGHAAKVPPPEPHPLAPVVSSPPPPPPAPLPSTPLQDARVMAFGITANPAKCRAFYEGTLGCRVIADDPMALVFDSGGIVIRMQKMTSHKPAQFTVLGWTVPDIRASVTRLTGAGVKFEHYDWMKMQDPSGVATFPNGDMVAWFKDPDGNVLSISQLTQAPMTPDANQKR